MDELPTALLLLAVTLLWVAGRWAVYVKANEPGWAALVPIYNWIVDLKIAGKPLWWVVFLFFPPTALVARLLIGLALARSFGRGSLYGLGIAFVPFVCLPMLGFGDHKYQGPAG